MLIELSKRIDQIQLRPFTRLEVMLLVSLFLFGACVSKIQPEPDTLYQNRAIGYEFSFTETDDSVRIDLRNINEDVLDVETIGFYAIDGENIIAIDALEIEQKQLEPQATTLITFAKDGEGFIIMNSAGSFVSGAMFEVRYQ